MGRVICSFHIGRLGISFDGRCEGRLVEYTEGHGEKGSRAETVRPRLIDASQRSDEPREGRAGGFTFFVFVGSRLSWVGVA